MELFHSNVIILELGLGSVMLAIGFRFFFIQHLNTHLIMLLV